MQVEKDLEQMISDLKIEVNKRESRLWEFQDLLNVKEKEIEQLGFEREGWQKDLESVWNELHARDLSIENLRN